MWKDSKESNAVWYSVSRCNTVVLNLTTLHVLSCTLATYWWHMYVHLHKILKVHLWPTDQGLALEPIEGYARKLSFLDSYTVAIIRPSVTVTVTVTELHSSTTFSEESCSRLVWRWVFPPSHSSSGITSAYCNIYKPKIIIQAFDFKQFVHIRLFIWLYLTS